MINKEEANMKQINEYSTGYPSSINSQSQEYQGVLGPMDAETVQGKDRFNLVTSEGVHRINSFLNHFFRRPVMNPKNELAQLRVRLNHLNLDFKMDPAKDLEETNTFILTTGSEVFGVTPTTDLSVGFDTGSDLPSYLMTVKVTEADEGFHVEAKVKPNGKLTEELIRKSSRDNRIAFIRKVMEDYEISKVRQAKDPDRNMEKAVEKDTRKQEKSKKPKK